MKDIKPKIKWTERPPETINTRKVKSYVALIGQTAENKDIT